MAGPSSHGQHNKAHKAGKKAGLSARQKHAVKKGGRVAPVHSSGKLANSRAERMNAAKVHRDKKRAEVLAQKREAFAPRVVALLPLSQAVNGHAAWQMILDACQEHSGKPAAKNGRQDSMDTGGTEWPMLPTTVSLAPRYKTQLTFLPPPRNPADPLAIVEIARAAESLVLLVPLAGEGEVDEAGLAALAVLRAMGLPSLVALVPAALPSMQAKSAAKKVATAQLTTQIAGEHKVFTGDAADCGQLVRHLAEHRGGIPHWRQQRPSLMLHAVDFQPAASQPHSSPGTLLLSGYIRNRGLTADQLLYIPGAGDFQMAQIDGPPAPPAAIGSAETSKLHSRGTDAMDTTGGEDPVLEVADPSRQETLQRENIPDPLAGEQTWPTAEELKEAEEEETQRRRLPKGTSQYQAAWILDDEGGPDLSDEEPEAAPAQAREPTGPLQPPSEAGSLLPMDSEQRVFFDDDGTATEADGLMDEDDSDAGMSSYEQQKRARHAEQDALQFPDEVDTPSGVRASVRFAKYRGLKSWRASPWDPREELPQEYARVFAFENFRRAHKRAMAAAEAASSRTTADGVPPGTYVRVHISNVDPSVAHAVLARHNAAYQDGTVVPLVATGLLQHEAKLSVLNFGVKKAATYEKAIPNKTELLLVTGVRSFVSRPIYSTDNSQADKHKMERFLHDGRNSVATVYGPVSYPPLPVLAFDTSSGTPQLAFTGTLRSVDPDRINLKKIVLTGFPVKVHKNKAVVRWMFHNPDDVLWFRPLDVWTKLGRRGRIKESVGTHGAMKCLFDGPIQQRDSVCVSLFKRVYPKWPADLNFAA